MPLKSALILLVSCWLWIPAQAQVDSTTTEEEDYSQYDNLDFVDGSVKRFCSAKIIGISPAKLVSIGYDFQLNHALTVGAADTFYSESADISNVQGVRFSANIPIISNNAIIVQLGANIWEMRYSMKNEGQLSHPMTQTLASNGLKTTGLNTTIFKPLNEKQFVLVQASADLNGDYSFADFQPLKYTRYSLAALWGKRTSDYKQWAIGLSRTYRAGEMNYIPVILYNWTSVNKKWGTEILFPARAHWRYSPNPRNMVFVGYELEGNSYRMGNAANDNFLSNNHEIRRSELRFRAIYEKQIKGFIWFSAQAGYRINYLFDVDAVADGKDFYRGFFGDQPYAFQNTLTNPLYFNFSINLVSP